MAWWEEREKEEILERSKKARSIGNTIVSVLIIIVLTAFFSMLVGYWLGNGVYNFYINAFPKIPEGNYPDIAWWFFVIGNVAGIGFNFIFALFVVYSYAKKQEKENAFLYSVLSALIIVGVVFIAMNIISLLSYGIWKFFIASWLGHEMTILPVSILYFTTGVISLLLSIFYSEILT